MYETVKKVSPTITLCFNKSTSKNFDYVFAKIKRMSSYNYDEETKLYSAIFTNNDIDLFWDIFEYVSYWKSSYIIVDDNKYFLSKIRKGLCCYHNKFLSTNPFNYCFESLDENRFNSNVFGCKYSLTNNCFNGWLTYGNLDSNNIFHVDKEKIKEIIIDRLNIDLQYCPALDMNEIMTNIDKLPNTINPLIDDTFDYLYDEYNKPYGIKFKDYNKNLPLYNIKTIDEHEQLDNLDTKTNIINTKSRITIFNKFTLFLTYIPGFRKRIKWRMIVASIYYLMAIAQVCNGRLEFIIMFLLPFVIFNLKYIKSLFGKFKDDKS